MKHLHGFFNLDLGMVKTSKVIDFYLFVNNNILGTFGLLSAEEDGNGINP